jgi:hypothetical protein
MELELEFDSEVIEWRGPAPFYFLPVPQAESDDIHEIARFVTYGWGVIPARVRIGAVDFETALFPKDGRYLVPLKVVVRKAAGIALGDRVALRVTVRGR